jgi:predicted AlkP superfamily pyrophosphatase or phosphodiesterase
MKRSATLFHMFGTRHSVLAVLILAVRCSLLAATILAACCSLLAAPKLVVVVSFDQMRGDFATRFEKVYQSKNGGGFARIRREGVDFESCYYRHASNITGPGHASLLTGCYPAKTGIVGNEFCDEQTKTCGYCAQDTAKVFSASKLLVPTLGDLLRQRSPLSKTVGVGLKDRASILMVGNNASACIWFDAEQRRFATSSAYKQPQWLERFNKRYSVERYAGRTWTSRIPADIGAEDNVAAEGRFPEGDGTFPHHVLDKKHDDFTASFLLSPFSMELLFDAALFAVQQEKLGKDANTDVLCIGVSTTDYVGHVYGPDSREVQELYVHADLMMERLINNLDKTVGRENYVLVVTSDHGVAPVPEILQRQAEQQKAVIDAGRIKKSEVKRAIDSAIASAIGPRSNNASYIKQAYEPSIYIDLSNDDPKKPRAIEAAVQVLRSHPGLAVVATASDIANNRKPPTVDDTTWSYVRNSFYPGRSGDIVYYPKRYWIIGGNVATHGTPHDYDRWVPLMFLGGGLKPQIRKDAVAPVDVAPTLGTMLGVTMDNIDGAAIQLGR